MSLIERLRGPLPTTSFIEGLLDLPVIGAEREEAADRLEAMQAEIERRDRVIAEMGAALDVADGVIAINCGMDAPKEWHNAFKRVAKARASLDSQGK